MLANKALSAAGAALLPTFVSGSSATANKDVTVTAPTGIQDGDMLVFIGCIATTGASVQTYPAGFIQVATTTSSNCLTVAYKIAASESGNYLFTWSASINASCTILVYRNATRINTVGAITSAASATATAASITPTFNGVLLSFFDTKGSATVSTPPSGMTQRAITSPSPRLASYELSPQAASASGAKTLVWSASADADGISIQLTNENTVAPEFVASASTQNTGAGTSLVINKPTGTVENDLMIAIMAIPAASTWTGDTSWTEVGDQGANPSLRIAYKVAGASEGASYTFTSSASSTGAGCILTYRYAAYDTIAGAFTTAANPLVLTSISPTASQSVLIAAGARGAASITLGTPTNMVARVTDNNATSPSYIVCDQTVWGGPSGTRSVSTGSTSNVSGVMLSIKPTRSL